MQHIGNRAGTGRQEGTEAGDDALAIIVRGGSSLVGRYESVFRDRDQIGERATDIDADAQGHAAGSHATGGSGFRSAFRRVRNAAVATASMTGGLPAATTP